MQNLANTSPVTFFKPLSALAPALLVSLSTLWALPSAWAQGVANSVLFATGLDAPVFLTAPPADERLFVLEQYRGRIRILSAGQLLPQPFLDLPSFTPFSTGFERGLLGLAFDPNYSSNGHVFVSYTGADGRSRVDRFTRSPGDANSLDQSSQAVVLEVPQPFESHNGGCLAFGPDGYLYVSLGDGGGDGDPECRAQNGQELLGKVLRIDVNSIDSTGSYAIPASNPFANTPGMRGEIFLLGLRNPWRFSFDSKTGDLYVADVGENEREEVTALPAYAGGANLGWKIQEGSQCHSTANCSPQVPICGSQALTGPTHEYDHLVGCSITGGFVYRGYEVTPLQGRYLFADYCSSQIWSLDWSPAGLGSVTAHTADLAPGGGLSIQFISSFGEDSNGELYVCELWSGEIFRITPPGTAGVAPGLRARFERLSISQGGLQSLTLAADPALAGRPYLVLGSASGTNPGLPLDGITVPLNFDSYLTYTLQNPNAGPFTRSLGLLGPNGRADALIRVPPGVLPATLVGQALGHAFVVFDPIYGTLSAASNSVELRFLP